MHSTAPRKMGALLLAGALVVVLAAPVAAAPARAVDHGPTFLQAVAAWLAAWLPGTPAGPTLHAAPTPIGPGADPSGAEATTTDGPAVTPQLGAKAAPSR